MPFCPKCGTEYQPDTKFCGKCGENLAPVATPVDAVAATVEPVALPVPEQTAAPVAEQPAAPASEPANTAIPVALPVPDANANTGANTNTNANANANANQGPNFIQKLMNTKDFTADFDANDLASAKGMAILAYCAIFAYILISWILGSFAGLLVCAGMMVAPCITAKKSPAMRYVISQLLVALFAVMIVGIFEGSIAAWIASLIRTVTFWSMAGNIIATVIAWLIHLIFTAVPIFVLIVGFIDIIKGKIKALPLIGNFRTIFESHKEEKAE